MGKHFDAPTSKGYHPHAVRPGTERAGEHSGYQTRSTLAGGADVQESLIRGLGVPNGSIQQQSMLDWAAQHPFLIAGLLLGGAALIATANPGPRSNPRSNPADGRIDQGRQQYLTAPVLMIPQCGPGQSTEQSGYYSPMGETQTAEQAARFGVAQQGNLFAPAKKKDKRTRRTSQARDGAGHYLPAGTRKKLVTEGKK